MDCAQSLPPSEWAGVDGGLSQSRQIGSSLVGEPGQTLRFWPGGKHGHQVHIQLCCVCYTKLLTLGPFCLTSEQENFWKGLQFLMSSNGQRGYDLATDSYMK